MTQLRKDEEQGAEDPDLYRSPPPELADHPLFSGKQTVGMMTAEAPRFPSQHSGGNAELQGELRKAGLQHELTHGSYGGPEHSFIIYGPTREQMYDLGKRYGQEAVIYGQDGKYEMMYTNGDKAGKSHPGLPLVRFSQKQPDDYYTHFPNRGYVTLHFGEKTHDSPVKQTMPMSMQAPAAVAKSEIVNALVGVLRKSAGIQRHPHSYPWHEGHTNYHHQAPAGGVILPEHATAKTMRLAKDESTGHPTNEQAAGVGVSTYAKHAQPYGNVVKGQTTNLKHYQMEGTGQKVNQLLQHHGYQVYYAGGKHGKADLAGKNYNTGHLMIWDPSEGSGGDFGHADYTDNWRKIHELAHALTYQQLNQKYGEGRRMGGVGKQRTPREAKRAVEWEWLAAHKQRELASQIGVHISDEDFHRELNTVMHDAVHRAVTGKFTEPSAEGFVPHAHKVPLETALGQVNEAALGMGLQGEHDVLKKFAADLAGALRNALKKSGA